MDRDEIRALDDEQFDELCELVEGEVKRRKNRRMRIAMKRARELAALSGFDVQLVPLGSVEQPARGMKPPKLDIPPGLYRDPESGAEWRKGTRGKIPAWIKEPFVSGMDISALRVEEEAEDADEERAAAL